MFHFSRGECGSPEIQIHMQDQIISYCSRKAIKIDANAYVDQEDGSNVELQLLDTVGNNLTSTQTKVSRLYSNSIQFDSDSRTLYIVPVRPTRGGFNISSVNSSCTRYCW